MPLTRSRAGRRFAPGKQKIHPKSGPAEFGFITLVGHIALMSVDTQNTIIALAVLAVLMLAAAVATALLCHFRIAHKKPVSYWMIFRGAVVVPLLLAIIATCFQSDIWWSREGKGSPHDFLISLVLLGLLCSLPAFAVVVRYKRRATRNGGRVA